MMNSKEKIRIDKVVREMERERISLVKKDKSKKLGENFESFLQTTLDGWRTELFYVSPEEVDSKKEIHTAKYAINHITSMYAECFELDFITKNISDLNLSLVMADVTLDEKNIESELLNYPDNLDVWNDALRSQPMSEDFIFKHIDNFRLINAIHNQHLSEEIKDKLRNIIELEGKF